MKQENKEAKKLIRKQQRFKLAVGMNTLVAVALFAVVVVMVNYVSYRRYWRADWSRSDFYTLSDKTVKLLNSVTNTINVVVFFQPGHSVYEDIENLLREYEYVSDRMRVTWVDPDRDLAQTERLAAKYEVNEANVIVFDVAGRFKYITADDVAEYDYSTASLRGSCHSKASRRSHPRYRALRRPANPLSISSRAMVRETWRILIRGWASRPLGARCVGTMSRCAA
jgi:hypothetical protein